MSTSGDFTASRGRFLKMTAIAGFGAAVTPAALFAQYRHLAPGHLPACGRPSGEWRGRLPAGIFVRKG